MLKAEVMSLGHALFILSEVHTREDDVAGFVVMNGASPAHSRWTQSEYIEAWKAVRHSVGLPVATVHERTVSAQERPTSTETNVNEQRT